MRLYTWYTQCFLACWELQCSGGARAGSTFTGNRENCVQRDYGGWTRMPVGRTTIILDIMGRIDKNICLVSLPWSCL
jgi:hypothetical protein